MTCGVLGESCGSGVADWVLVASDDDRRPILISSMKCLRKSKTLKRISPMRADSSERTFKNNF